MIEAGCGVGAAMLAAAARWPGARSWASNATPTALALAHRNIAANGLGERVEAHAGDIGAGAAPGGAPFDAALCNPPFFDDPGGAARAASGQARRLLADAAWPPGPATC